MKVSKLIDCATQADVDKVTKAGDVAVVRSGFYEARAGTVRAFDSSTVRASGSSTVEAFDSSTVRASGSSTVRAFDSSTVRASGSSTVRAFGSSTVHATNPNIPIQDYGTSGEITGHGTIIKIRLPQTASEWCAYYDVPLEGGVATLYKAVRDDFRSGHGMLYEPGTAPEAPDWDPVPECGGGLHFSPRPFLAKWFDSAATRFVACPVRLDEIVVHPNGDMPEKVKAPRLCAPVWECDEDGDPV